MKLFLSPSTSNPSIGPSREYDGPIFRMNEFSKVTNKEGFSKKSNELGVASVGTKLEILINSCKEIGATSLCNSFSKNDASRFSFQHRCSFRMIFLRSTSSSYLFFDCFSNGAFECLYRPFSFFAISISSGAARWSSSFPIFLAASITNFRASGNATHPIPEANAPNHCLVVCNAPRNGVGLLGCGNMNPYWQLVNFWNFKVRTTFPPPAKRTSPPVSVRKFAEILEILDQKFSCLL